MDRTIEKKPASLRRIVIGVSAVALSIIGWQVLSRTTGASRLRIDSSRVTTAFVQSGEFLEYYPFDGSVQPATSVFLDIEGGGRVDQILVEGGQYVEQGDLILRFSNASLRQSALNTETSLLYNLDIQRTTLFNRQQSTLLLKEALLDLDHQIVELDKRHKRYEALMKNRDAAISVAEFETTRDQLKYLEDRRALMAERVRREDELSVVQLAQANRAIARLNTGVEIVGQIVASLDVRAPISGYLSTIDAQVGQNVPAGKRIGQIDLLDKFKVRVKIDQYYISRVEIGTRGHVDLDGKSWPVAVQKIYPEVSDNTFQADVVFEAESPSSIKRGQTLTVELSFGEPTNSLKVAKGGFYQQASGRWVYLVSEDGKRARRTNVRLGRQNPREVEVLDGLRDGDRIITSGYDSYNGVEELTFNEALKKQGSK
jgi:HlyD family secretion protein